jgi:peptide/nickel transport system substrate-binding protein
MTTKNSRWLAAGAVFASGALALSACSSSGTSKPQVKVAANYAFGAIPAQSSTVKEGGVLKIAQDAGQDPNNILPIVTAANSSVYDINQFNQLSWRPLFWSPKGSVPEIDYTKSMTDAAPTVSADGKTFTIKLNGKYTWSDGSPLTTADVEFYVDELKAAVKENPANSGNYTPGQFPDNVTTMTATDANTINFTFDKVYNPTWVIDSELGLIVPMPAKAWAKTSENGATVDYTNPDNAKAIWDFLEKQSNSLSTYATDPLWQTVDGPFKISYYNASTGAANFKANTAYTGASKPHIAELDELSYTSDDAEFNDLLAGNLDVGYVPSKDYTQTSKLTAKKYAVYGLPDFGFNYIFYNFKDTTDNFDKVIGQLYIRQAFAHLQDEEGEIKGIYHGAAAPAYGSVPVAPQSPYTPANALTNPFPFSVDAATKLLKDHGWTVVPNGKTTCTSPGTGANQCGPGISAGQDISFVLYYVSSKAATTALVTSWVGNLKKIGVDVTLKGDTFNNIIANESVASSPKNNANWGAGDFGGFTNGIYPSTDNLFNTGGSYNQGGFSDPALDTLINNSLNSTDPNAIQKELAAVTADQPGIFQPNEDRIYAWKTNISGPSASFETLTQFGLNPEDWYFTK